jgi:hypothetical protein
MSLPDLLDSRLNQLVGSTSTNKLIDALTLGKRWEHVTAHRSRLPLVLIAAGFG